MPLHELQVQSISGQGAGANAQDVAYTGGSNPEHAKPGEVWCLMTTPPTFKTVSEQYECKPASCRANAGSLSSAAMRRMS